MEYLYALTKDTPGAVNCPGRLTPLFSDPIVPTGHHQDRVIAQSVRKKYGRKK